MWISIIMYTYIMIYIYMSKASGVGWPTLALSRGGFEAYLDHLAPTEQLSDFKNLIRGPLPTVLLMF